MIAEKQFFIDRAEKKAEDFEAKLELATTDRDGTKVQMNLLRDVLSGSKMKG